MDRTRPQSYISTSSTDYEEDVENYDLEKEDSSDDNSDCSTSSIVSIHSTNYPLNIDHHEPILRKLPRKSRQRLAFLNVLPSRSWMRCSPRNSSRLFTLLLFSTIVVFIFTLTQLSWSSARSVSLGHKKPPPPPPVWEQFPFLKRYHGGIRTLVSRESNAPEYPSTHEDEFPSLNQVNGSDPREFPASKHFDPYGSASSSEIKTCYLDKEKKTRVPDVLVYPGVPYGMPENVMGSYDALGLRDDVCFERYGRLGPYGFGYSKKTGGSGAGIEGDRQGADAVWDTTDFVDYRSVRWAEAQSTCIEANSHRFKVPSVGKPQSAETFSEKIKRSTDTKEDPETSLLAHKAVIIRTWSDYNYDDEDLFYLRSLIWELSLQTGGEYTVHFLIHVKNNNIPIWADEETYQRVLNESLPEEFRGMGTLWSEHQMSMIYNGLHDTLFRDLPVHGVYRAAFMSLSWFAHRHPEYEYYWNFEMDTRYTGHYYDLISKSASWAAKQPRKGLWERNARFFIPSEHGSWEEFTHMIRVQTDHGTASKSNIWSNLANNPEVPEFVKEEMTRKVEKAVWGPRPPPFDTLDNTTDIWPLTSMAKDKYEWGVGEEADLITFNPIFDPQGTSWLLTDDITGYNTSSGMLPRRAAVINFSRLSRQLLLQMHRDTALSKKLMFSEMWPATTALHHGLKAVYIPHPVFIDRRWPTDYLATIFNAGRNGASGGNRMSVFSDARQHNFKGTTWYYDAGFAPNLWKRWLGYKVDNDGGEAEEVAGEGRMCLPAMLLHPVKQVDLLYETETKLDD